MLAAGFGVLWDFASMISSKWAAVGIVGDNITNSNVPSKVSEVAEIVTDIVKSGNLPSPVSLSIVSDPVKEIITTNLKSQSQEADNEQRTRNIKNYNKIHKIKKIVEISTKVLTFDKMYVIIMNERVIVRVVVNYGNIT